MTERVRRRRFKTALMVDVRRDTILAVKALRQLERKHGHHEVFVAIREWMAHPIRGKEWFDPTLRKEELE